MERKNRFWLGLLILLLTPWAVLAAFAIYVWVVNAQPQPGPLQTRVSPQVVLPWQESAYYVDFSGHKPGPVTAAPPPPPPPPPVDAVFMIDESGSMTATFAAMAEYANQMVQELAKEQPGRIRFALIRFDTTAEVTAGWTDDPAKLQAGLKQLVDTAKGGDNNSREAFAKLSKLLDSARPAARPIVIFYTDGGLAVCSCVPMSESEMVAAAKELREKRGVEIYSVGLPGSGSAPLMLDIAGGDPSHIIEPVDTKDLANSFRTIKSEVGKPGPTVPDLPEGSGNLAHRLDGRHFAAPLEGTSWTAGSRGTLNLVISPIPEAPSTYAHPLVPLSIGLWRVGVEPPVLSFIDKEGKSHTFNAPRRPLLLNITWLLLFLMFLPALLWVLAPLLQRRPRAAAVKPEIALPEIPPPTLPERLEVPERLEERRLPPVPTIFIGLGGAGRRALHAIRADLRQAHLGQAGEPYRFLWLDTDTQEAQREAPFEAWEGYPIEELLAPPRVSQTQNYLPQPGQTAGHLRWFNPNHYHNAPNNRLSLKDGAKGDRALARLALFEWLATPNSLLANLVEQVKQLSALPSSDEVRQIVVVASADGGVGTGWFLDLGRLLQRVIQQQQGLAIPPDVIGLLCQEPQPQHPENRQALALEVESAIVTGQSPHRVIYQPGAALLDQVDRRGAYQWVFAATASEANSLAAQCGNLAAVLVERQPRAKLLEQTGELRPRGPVEAVTYGAHVLPTLIYDQVRCELFLRLLGPDILLDVMPDRQGGLRPKPVAKDAAFHQLDDWSRAETPGSPLQLLLAAAVNPPASVAFANLMQSASAAPRDWFGQAFAAALTQRLQGHAQPGGIAWQRDCMPSEASATLRLLAQQLTNAVQPELRARKAVAASEAAEHVANLANAAADELDKWVQEFCRVCEHVAKERNALEQARRKLLRLQGRVYLDWETKPEQIERWARSGLEGWVDTPDTVSGIRKRLFFAATAQGSGVTFTVRSFIGEPQDYSNAADVAAAIDHLARILASRVPTIRIGGALADLDPQRRRAIARELVRSATTPHQVLVITPQTVSNTQQVVEEFKAQIPLPTGQAPRTEQAGDDHSAIRRIELTEAAVVSAPPAGPPPPFVEPAERAAELLRQRAEQHYRIAVPVFPPRLRIALGEPETFRSFARAYKAGHIVVKPAPDEGGREQWFSQDTQLTFGKEQSLASAAAGYLWRVENPPETFAPAGKGGSFARLEQWQAQRGVPDEETLAQIAMSLYD